MTTSRAGSERQYKRARYVSKACDECKRRKTKCDGNSSCQKCQWKGVPCRYSDTGDTAYPHIGGESPEPEHAPAEPPAPAELSRRTHEQLAAIDDRLRALETLTNRVHATVLANASHGQTCDEERGAASPSRESSSGQPSLSYAGPTSAEYMLELVQDALSKTTSDCAILSAGSYNDVDAVRTRGNTSSSATASHISRPHALDSLIDLGQEQVMKLCRAYAIFVGSMYPLVDMEILEAQAETSSWSNDNRDHNIPRKTSKHDTQILYAVVAIGLALESGGKSEVGERLISQLTGVAGRMLYPCRLGICDIQLLGLMALYYVHTGEELLASRFISLASRGCLEAGWHRGDVLQRLFPVASEQSAVVNIFWSIYMLDRRASLGLGIPYIISDAEIDCKVPIPSNHYLSCMLDFARLTGKAFHSINSHVRGTHCFSADEMDYLDFQIERWYANISPSLKLQATHDEIPDDTMIFLRAVLFARKNQARLLVYRPSLMPTESVAASPSRICTAVQIAQDTISALSIIACTTTVYTRQPVVFNYFIVSSLAILVLAANHSPTDFTTDPMRDAFRTATALIKDSCKISIVASRLWHRFSVLERLGASSGLGQTAETPLVEGISGAPSLPSIAIYGSEPAHAESSEPWVDFDLIAQGPDCFYDFLGTESTAGVLPHQTNSF